MDLSLLACVIAILPGIQLSDASPEFPIGVSLHSDRKHVNNDLNGYLQRSKLGVDDDPEFIVRVEGMEDPLCFHVGGQQGDVLRLLQHEQLGIYVNGKIIERNETRKTYLGAVAILRHNVRVIASRKFVQVNRYKFSWTAMNVFLLYGHRVIIGNNLMAVTFRNKNVTLVIRRHVIIPVDTQDTSEALGTEGTSRTLGTDDTSTSLAADDPSETLTSAPTDSGVFVYLGFYISDSRGFRQNCHGLLGQFVHKSVSITRFRSRNGRYKARLSVLSPGYNSARTVMATQSERVNRATNVTTQCWLLRRDGAGVVDGSVVDYIVPDLRSKEVIRFQ